MGDEAYRLKDLGKAPRAGVWVGCEGAGRTGQGGLASDTFIIDQLRGNQHAHQRKWVIKDALC